MTATTPPTAAPAPHHPRLVALAATTLPVLTPATLAATAGLLPWPAIPAIATALTLRACLLTP
ncbi:hypothetical protein [Kitasatospora sp. NPDC097691]|uniref:hypothetical protein n=1 Tax=Kitasatospora sp. NPDC097691 TaxID=3157231 RepID=UPI003319E5E4